MAATTYFRDLLLGHALLQKPFSIEKWYVGLWRADPTAAGDLTNEVVQADYSRKAVLWGSTYVNANTIDWASPVNDWGDITYVALLNSPDPGSGNMLAYEPLPETFPMPVGQPATIPPGGLVVTI